LTKTVPERRRLTHIFSYLADFAVDLIKHTGKIRHYALSKKFSEPFRDYAAQSEHLTLPQQWVVLPTYRKEAGFDVVVSISPIYHFAKPPLFIFEFLFCGIAST